jgi:CDP-diacylglycerol--glycerol-3-phosphate 3-phosphatidyltransferase
MQKHVPNALTVLRLMLAGVFFLLISGYRYPDGPVAVLWVAMSVFIVAAITDVLDGHLARKWRVETRFGRIMDPFCDKVLIIGALIFLCGPRFVDPGVTEAGRDFPFNMLPGNNVTGIYPWMVTLMLARELLVTDIRGELESQGMQFGARLSGKLKMILQSVTIPAVIGIVALDPNRYEWLEWPRHVLVFTMLIATVISGLPYIAGAARVMRGRTN